MDSLRDTGTPRGSDTGAGPAPDPAPRPNDTASALRAVRDSGADRVKVAVADIDGVLRGKCIHVDKLAGALDSGFGFNVFGTDISDNPLDDDYMSGRRLGFPDAMVLLDPATYRRVPWDEDVPFFLGNFVKPDGSPHPLCPRQVLKRVVARARQMGFTPYIGTEYEFFNFRETPQSWAEKDGRKPMPITHGMFAYSLLRANAHRDYFTALMRETARFGIPLESLHTETGPGVYEAAILYGEAVEAADRAVLFKDAAKEIASRFGIMPSFMAKWNRKLPGCSGHVHQSLSDGKKNVFYDAKNQYKMSKIFESYLAGQLACLEDIQCFFAPTVNSYKRLVDGMWAPVKKTWGVDNRTASLRVIPGSAKSTRLETRCPGADTNPYLALAASVASGLYGIQKGLKLKDAPLSGDSARAAKIPRLPRNLKDAAENLKRSKIARELFGEEFVDHYARTREWEWRQFQDAVTDWELKRYFEII